MMKNGKEPVGMTDLAPLDVRGQGTAECVMGSGYPASQSRWKLGGCPRCKGDLYLERDDGMTFVHCLQCGYIGENGERI